MGENKINLLQRCGWCGTDQLYVDYHDNEWGREGIIRNRRKTQATISNAQLFLNTQKEFGSFCNYLKSFLPEGKPIINHWKTLEEVPASTPVSDTISKDMKKRGFKFFGTTICYAHLQAVGYINDHITSCHCHPDNQ